MKLKKKTIRDVNIKKKRLIMRVDFNVPVDEKSNVLDNTKILGAMETIQYALKKKAKIVLMSHMGRPKGNVLENKRLWPAGKKLQELLKKPVKILNDCVGEEVEKTVEKMKYGDIVLLENLRFHPEEEKNDPEFSKKLASYGDIFVQDAFGTAHRAHASTVGITEYLPSVAGLLVDKEFTYLRMTLSAPERPFLLVLGGAKVSSKIGIIDALLDKIDTLLIGGGMCFTFLKAMGYQVGNSLVEEDKIDLAKTIMGNAKKHNVELVLPSDFIVTDSLNPPGKPRIVDAMNLSAGDIGVDIGPRSILHFEEKIIPAKTVFWNGPMGVFETPEYSRGTFEIARYLSELNTFTVVGGGESATVVNLLNLGNKFQHVSTGGGATLKFIEGVEMPALDVLDDLVEND